MSDSTGIRTGDRLIGINRLRDRSHKNVHLSGTPWGSSVSLKLESSL